MKSLTKSIVTAFAVLATALYMCNTLTYVRPPLGRDIVSPVVY